LNLSQIFVSTDNGQTWNPAHVCYSNYYCYNWDTTKEKDGMAYGIIAKATDVAGNTGYSEMVIVIVDNGAPEGVYVISPTKDEIVSGNLTMKVLATDYASGVKDVQISIKDHGSWDAELVDGIWQYTINTTSLPDGEYEIYAYADDYAGNDIISTSVPFIIDNNPPVKPQLYVNDPEGDGYDTDGTVTWYWNESNDEGSGIDYYRHNLLRKSTTHPNESFRNNFHLQRFD
jgi:hypothetical protein